MAPLLYDAHNHLQDSRFNQRQSQLLQSCRAVGIAGMVVNGSSEADWAEVLRLTREFQPLVIPSFGYHPWHIHHRSPHWQSKLENFLDSIPSGVGEIGLDRWRKDLPYTDQEEVFVCQLRIATSRNVPASIHCLQAWGRLLNLLRTNPRPARGFILHSYGGPAELVPELADLGAYFSFPGYFAHERKAKQRDTFRKVPLERLLIETDAPDQMLPESLHPCLLTDSTTQQRLNHPANLATVYSFLAAFLGIDLHHLAASVADSTRRLWPQAAADPVPPTDRLSCPSPAQH